ncbi:MAG: tetratricopeptide repeat protein [Deltaproteobacteria bacterium]|nr:tetratricopeptide repeat protein [Deltaproteobacteria bacterium]
MDSQLSVEELLGLARGDLARNSVTSAEKALEQAILLNNQIPEAFHLLGHVYTKKGKFKRAILAFERALNLDPFHTEAAIALSSLYNDVGRYRDGAKVFYKTKKRLERTLPGHDPRIGHQLAKKHYELGQLYIRYERFEEAFEEFKKAHQLEEDTVLYGVQMAKCLAKTGDRQRATDFLQKISEAHPKSVEVKVQLGILYHSQQKLLDALREWQEALTLDPENKSAQMYLSMLEYEKLPAPSYSG